MLMLAASLAPEDRVALIFPEAAGGPVSAERAGAEELDAVALDTEDEACVTGFLGEQALDILHVPAGIGWEAQARTVWRRAAGAAVVRAEHLPGLVPAPEQEGAYAPAASSVDVSVVVSDAASATWAPALARLRPGARGATISNGIVPPRARALPNASRAVPRDRPDLLQIVFER